MVEGVGTGESGAVIDYITVPESNQTNYTFSSTETYYLPTRFGVSNCAFESGTVLKYEVRPRRIYRRLRFRFLGAEPP
jgi:hypothetical protein